MKVKAIDLEKVVLVEADIYRFRSVTLSLQLNLVSADRDTLPPGQPWRFQRKVWSYLILVWSHQYRL